MLSRRSLLVAAAGTALAPLATGLAARATTSAPTPQPPSQQRLRVGLMTFRMPPAGEPSSVPTGWHWVAETPDGIQLLVLGRSASPTPELALVSVLAMHADGHFGLQVTGHPPVSVAGADLHRVWTVRTTGSPVRTGNLVAATLGRETAVCLLTGPEGWSPSERRSVLSSLEVSSDG